MLNQVYVALYTVLGTTGSMMLGGLRRRRPLLYSLQHNALGARLGEDHHGEGLHSLFYREKRGRILFLDAPAAACATRPSGHARQHAVEQYGRRRWAGVQPNMH